jgi:SlyX protein
LNEQIRDLEEKVAYLERHVAEQDKVMLEFSRASDAVQRELKALRERPVNRAAQAGRRPNHPRASAALLRLGRQAGSALRESERGRHFLLVAGAEDLLAEGRALRLVVLVEPELHRVGRIVGLPSPFADGNKLQGHAFSRLRPGPSPRMNRRLPIPI